MYWHKWRPNNTWLHRLSGQYFRYYLSLHPLVFLSSSAQAPAQEWLSFLYSRLIKPPTNKESCHNPNSNTTKHQPDLQFGLAWKWLNKQPYYPPTHKKSTVASRSYEVKIYWHERSVLQLVTVSRSTVNDVGGHYFRHYFCQAQPKSKLKCGWIVFKIS